MKTDITKKQYILASQKLSLDMNEHKVGQRYLYTDHKLLVRNCTTANGTEVWLLGYAFCTDGEKSVEEDIKNFSGESLTELYAFGQAALYCSPKRSSSPMRRVLWRRSILKTAPLALR